MHYNIEVGSHQWRVFINRENEVSFGFRLPEQKVEADPFWRGPDEDDGLKEVPDFNFGPMVVPPGVSIFELKTKITNAIVGLVQRSNKAYFSYQPTDKKRSRLYKVLAEELVEKLDGDWTYQSLPGTIRPPLNNYLQSNSIKDGSQTNHEGKQEQDARLDAWVKAAQDVPDYYFYFSRNA